MSLVSEALKKAQREAAVREGRDKGLPEPLLAGAQPFRARRQRRSALLGAAAIAVVLAAAAAFVGWKATSASGPASQRRSVEEDSGPGAAPESAQAVPTPASAAVQEHAPAAPSPAAPPTPSPVATAIAPPPSALEVSGRPAGAASPIAAPATGPHAPEARAAAAGHTSEPETFLRAAKLADGTEIRLGGIAWSETAPLAYVNGKLVGAGEVVAGCAVRAIERDRVRLTCSGTGVDVRLR